MNNTNIIFKLPFIQDLLSEIHNIEDDRIYCRHNLVHFFDTARIFYILILENKLEISKDLAYTVAFLHDLGRVNEYKDGTKHDISSCEIANKALEFTNFTDSEKEIILSCIKNHRKNSEVISIESLFYKADKLSRDCFNCKSYESCNWSKEKKNLEIKY